MGLLIFSFSHFQRGLVLCVIVVNVKVTQIIIVNSLQKKFKTFNSLFNSTVKESLLLFYLQDHSTYVDKDVGSIGGVGKIKKFSEPFCRDISGEFLWQYSSHFIIHILTPTNIFLSENLANN